MLGNLANLGKRFDRYAVRKIARVSMHIHFRNQFVQFGGCSMLGDIQAIASGKPKRIAKRAANKIIGRKFVSRIWRR